MARGLPDPDTTRGRWDRAFHRFAAEVLPRLRDPGPLAARLERLRDAPASVLVHGDLRPEHVLVADGPCYAVTHGLDTGDDALVAASLEQLAAS